MSIFDQTFNGSSIIVLKDLVDKESSSQAEKKAKPKNPQDLFFSEWLNKSLYDSRRLKRLRPIEKEISEKLADHLRGQLDSKYKQQALFSLLGFGYVQKHFPHHRYEPRILDELDPEKEKELTNKMRAFVDEKVKLCLDDYKEKQDGLDKKLIKTIREIFSGDMQEQINKKLVNDSKVKVKKGRRGRQKLVEVADTIPDRVKFIEDTLMDILTNVPEMNQMILEELAQRVVILPTIFRQQLFDRLYMGSTNRMLSEAERVQMKREYVLDVKDVLKNHNLANVGEWHGRKAVDAAVILAFERSQALKEELESGVDDSQLEESETVDDKLVFYTRILSIAKLCNNNHSSTHIFWLIRAAKYFPESNLDSKEDKAINLAFHFNKFSQSDAVFHGSKVFSLAQSVIKTLEQEEPLLMNQIREGLKSGTDKADPTLFSQEIIVEDLVKSKEVLKRFLKKKVISKEDEHCFQDFRLFVRKWMSEAFVGILSRNGASLVWDFLFIQKFSDRATIRVCLGLFNLLKPLLESAHNFREIHDAVMEGPKVLLIRDLRRVLQHLNKPSGSYRDIPSAPSVPSLQITPPSAREERRALDRRIEVLNNLDV